jgi:hypothetical protein
VSAGNGSYSRVSVQVGADWQVRWLPVPKQAPVLDIDAGETQITVGIAGREIRASAVEFAAELARVVSQFAAEVERLYADQQTGTRAEPAQDPAA